MPFPIEIYQAQKEASEHSRLRQSEEFLPQLGKASLIGLRAASDQHIHIALHSAEPREDLGTSNLS